MMLIPLVRPVPRAPSPPPMTSATPRTHRPYNREMREECRSGYRRIDILPAIPGQREGVGRWLVRRLAWAWRGLRRPLVGPLPDWPPAPRPVLWPPPCGALWPRLGRP